MVQAFTLHINNALTNRMAEYVYAKSFTNSRKLLLQVTKMSLRKKISI